MSARAQFAESLVDTALVALTSDSDQLSDALDALPVAIYVTDPSGAITHYNRACIALAGRTPDLKHDRWCVTWRLYTSAGAPLPHAECPMAVALREQRPIRQVEAIAERPDGTRIQLMPFPTPYFNADGSLAGAINLLLDVTEERQIDTLRAQAARCRRLATGIDDRRAFEALTRMAVEYDAQADLIATPH